MNWPMLHPPLHGGAWGWHDYLLLLLALLVLIGIASMGSKPDQNRPDAGDDPPDRDQ